INFRAPRCPRTWHRKAHRDRWRTSGSSGDHDAGLRGARRGRGRGNRNGRRGETWLRRPATFFSDPCSENVARLVDSQGGDFFFRGTIENEAFSGRRDSINETAAVRTRDQIAL